MRRKGSRRSQNALCQSHDSCCTSAGRQCSQLQHLARLPEGQGPQLQAASLLAIDFASSLKFPQSNLVSLVVPNKITLISLKAHDRLLTEWSRYDVSSRWSDRQKMSALGQTRSFDPHQTSVCFAPEADIKSRWVMTRLRNNRLSFRVRPEPACSRPSD